MLENILEVDSVMLEFGDRRILSDIYLRFETGKITGILGRNGAGKSCLLRIIFGTLTAQYSSVRLNQQALFKTYRHAGVIKYLPQKSFIPGYLRLQKILDLFSCNPQDFFNDFPEFAGTMKKPFRIFSFGQKRLIETYILLKSPSDFILLDEPFSYIMPVHADKLKQIIGSEKKGKGIVITDHLYRDLLDFADRLYLITDGRSVPVKSPDDLRLYGYVS